MRAWASVEAIDTAMRLGAHHPMGPLELADFIGLDTCLSVMQVLYEGLADSKYRPCPLLVKYVEAGWLGRKTQARLLRLSRRKAVPPADSAAVLSATAPVSAIAARISQLGFRRGPDRPARARRPISRPSRSTSTDAGRPMACSAAGLSTGSTHRASRRSPWRRRKAAGRRRPLRSMLMARTSESGPPSWIAARQAPASPLRQGRARSGPQIDQRDLAAPIREA